MAAFDKITSNNVWAQNLWNNLSILCQDGVQPRLSGFNGIFSNHPYIITSTSTLCLFQFGLILLVISFTSFFLRPLGLPIHSQMAGGVIVMGLMFPSKEPGGHVLLPDPVFYILRTISHFGFGLHSFMLGVETNMGALRKVGKKSITICLAGSLASLSLSFVTYNLFRTYRPGYLDEQGSSLRLILLQSQNFFAVTCAHVNNLGISNSELGRLASAIALVIDVLTMFTTFIVFNVVLAVQQGDYWQPLIVIADFAFLFIVIRPIILHIVSHTSEGDRMSQDDFLAVLLAVFVAIFTGYLINQQFAVFLFALSIPQEPLSSILAEKLDTITSGFLFPVFCAVHGFQASYGSLMNLRTSFALELLLLAGQVGKFIAIFISSRWFSIPWRKAISLAVILSSKGFFDIAICCQWREEEILSVQEYTLTSLHILIYTGALLPLVRKLYKPSEQYNTIFRQNVTASSENGSLLTLACIYNEENVHGIIQFLEALNPSRGHPIPVVTIQLIPLTGRCSLPIMAPFSQVKSYAALRANIARCNRIVTAFSYLERKFRGYTRLQHYVSVASYATMHNDICNLAYEKNVGLVILPFHIQWSLDGSIDRCSNPIREVNKMVFAKAPCSVGILIDRGDKDLIQAQLYQKNDDMYRVVIFFIGGPDDQEAIAYCDYFANHPFIKLTIVWLSSISHSKRMNSRDYQVLEKCRRQNERKINFHEVVCSDGTETTTIINSLKLEVDLAVVGKHHDPQCPPLFGLVNQWNDYPELGVLAAFLVASDFSFSVLVVQKEPQRSLDYVYDDELIGEVQVGE